MRMRGNHLSHRKIEVPELLGQVVWREEVGPGLPELVPQYHREQGRLMAHVLDEMLTRTHGCGLTDRILNTS